MRAPVRWLWAVLILAVVATLPVVLERWRMEASMRHVELVADWDSVQELARATGTPAEEILRQWRGAGLTALAVSPYRLADIGRSGRDFVLVSGGEIVRSAWLRSAPPDLGGLPLEPQYTYIGLAPRFVTDPAREDLVRAVQARFSDRRSPVRGARRADGWWVLAVPVSDPYRVFQAELELDPRGVRAAAEVGLRLVPRWSNAVARGGERLPALMAEVMAQSPQGLGPVIFTGSEAVGYPYLLPETAQLLRRHGLAAGWVEFARQRGLDHLVPLLDGQAVRVHSITPGEMQRISRETAVQRWVRAVRERGIRVLYLRPFLRAPGGEDLLRFNEQYLQAVVDGLRQEGYEPGPATAVGAWRGPVPHLLMAAAGVGAAAALLLSFVGFRHPLGQGAVTLLAVGLTGVLYLKGYTALSRQATAFAASVIFPLLAAVVSAGRLRQVGQGQPGPSGRGWRQVASALGVGVLITWAGAILLVGALADYRFMLGSEQFLGVKAAHALPVAGVLVLGLWMRWEGSMARWWAGRQVDGRPQEQGEPPKGGQAGGLAEGRAEGQDTHPVGAGVRDLRGQARPGAFWRAVWVGLLELAGQPVRWGQLVLLVLALAAFGIYVLRTGHDVLPVGDWELRLRLWLETLLPVRPRTKEILVGYPAWVVSLALLRGWGEGWNARRTAGWLVLAAAVVAPVSLINSFAHIHSPLAVSLVRSLLGMVIGLCLGAALWAALAAWNIWRSAAHRPGLSAGDGVSLTK